MKQLPKGAQQIGASVAMAGFYNPTSSTKEIHFEITDYFDSTGDATTNFCTQYQFDPRFDILQSALGDDPLCRVLSARFEALPKFSLDSSSSAVMVAFTLPVRYAQSSESVSSHQQTTLLTPSSVYDWTRVGQWNTKSAFENSDIQPTGGTGAYPLGTLAVINPDTLEPSTEVVQYRVVYEVAQTLPLVYTVAAQVATGGSSLWSEVMNVNPDTQTVLINVKGVSDST